MLQEQASWVCRCEDRVVQRLEQDFKVTLQQQNSLEQWAAWLDGVVSQVLKPYQGSSGFPKAAKLFLLKWSFYRCAPVLGFWPGRGGNPSMCVRKPSYNGVLVKSCERARESPVAHKTLGKQPCRPDGLLVTSPSSMVIRDLTLRSAASFGSFHLIRLLYDEYMYYLIEHRVAQAKGETPIAVMGEVRPMRYWVRG